MTCAEFIATFSDVHDGTAPAELAVRSREHADACLACARYARVLEQGVELLRALPAPEIHKDFVPVLRRRLNQVEQEALLRRHTNSGATSVAVLAMAAVLVAVAWAPALRPAAPSVDLPPIVVSAPPPTLQARSLVAFSAFARQALAVPGRRPSAAPAYPVLEADLWGDARTLLFEYSRLAQRYGQRSQAARSGLDDQ